MPSLSLSRKQSHKPSVSSKSGSGVEVERQPAVKQQEPDQVSVDHIPGGDAMVEVLTRLQSLQDSFRLQLQVLIAMCACLGKLHLLSNRLMLLKLVFLLMTRLVMKSFHMLYTILM